MLLWCINFKNFGDTIISDDDFFHLINFKDFSLGFKSFEVQFLRFNRLLLGSACYYYN